MMLKYMLIALMLMTLLCSCAPGSKRFDDQNRPANFFIGVWHGWIAPITLIWQLFNHSIRIYETNNTGWTYDFGFYIAIIGGFGGFALSRRKTKKR